MRKRYPRYDRLAVSGKIPGSNDLLLLARIANATHNRDLEQLAQKRLSYRRRPSDDPQRQFEF
jgi:hypothetical protein